MIQKFCRSALRRRYSLASYQPRLSLLATNGMNRRYFSNETQFDVAVVGGGPGGYSCAIKCAQLGLKTVCIEGRGTLGGTCLNVGCIPSKSLLHNSHLYYEATHDFAKRGIIIGDIKLDLETLMKAKEGAVNGLTQGVEGLFKKNKVKYVQGWGKLTGSSEVTVTNTNTSETSQISCKNIVIATGSESAGIPGITIDESDIISSTGALSLSKVPEHLVIVGAGVIGLELGSVWSRLGSKVTVVEFLDRILPGVDNGVASKYEKLLKKQGFTFKLSQAVKSIDKTDSNLTINFEDRKSGKIDSIIGDKCLIAIGRVPYTAGLGLNEMGVGMDDRGRVSVNSKWQSVTHSNIYAIGDVIDGPMLAHKAEDEGIATANVICGLNGHVSYNAIPSVIYGQPEVAFVGKTEEQLKNENISYKIGEYPFMASSRARTNMDPFANGGSVKVLADKTTDLILGVHIIGPNAGEMIAEAVIGIEYCASAEDFALCTHAHPTFSESFREACMLASTGKCIHF